MGITACDALAQSPALPAACAVLDPAHMLHAAPGANPDTLGLDHTAPQIETGWSLGHMFHTPGLAEFCIHLILLPVPYSYSSLHTPNRNNPPISFLHFFPIVQYIWNPLPQTKLLVFLLFLQVTAQNRFLQKASKSKSPFSLAWHL